MDGEVSSPVRVDKVFLVTIIYETKKMSVTELNAYKNEPHKRPVMVQKLA